MQGSGGGGKSYSLYIFVKWLDGVFQRQYLPCFSISYVAINKDFDKLICYDQPGCNDIGVVIATKRHHYLFYLQPASNQYSSRELSPPMASSMFVRRFE